MAEDKDLTVSAREKREIAMAARATIELFGNGAIAKTKERLWEAETEGREESITYWKTLLVEVERMHRLRHKY